MKAEGTISLQKALQLGATVYGKENFDLAALDVLVREHCSTDSL